MNLRKRKSIKTWQFFTDMKTFTRATISISIKIFLKQIDDPNIFC